MEILNTFLDKLAGLIPTVTALGLSILVLILTRLFIYRRYAGTSGQKFRYQMTILILSFIGLLVIILTLPVSDATVGQLLSLFGLLLSAAIALSATTFVGNIMAGLMLRAVRNFRGGDFVRVGDHFGRVSERGLFHIEIQTEQRDLITLPNMYLVTNPVQVVRSSGTLVTADVSLGYDVPHDIIEKCLLEATTGAGLEEAFVQVVDLGDFSVTYRAAGLLTEVKGLISARSRLRTHMLDRLHGHGIEIVSPTFMNQRVLTVGRPILAKVAAEVPTDEPKDLPEAMVFDKAEEAETLEMLRHRLGELQKEVTELKGSLDAADEAAKADIEKKLDVMKARVERLTGLIVRREKKDE